MLGIPDTGNHTGIISGITTSGNNVTGLDFGIQHPVLITGTVFNDINGNTIINSGELGTTANTNLYVYLVNGSGIVVDSAKVASNGTYSLQASANTNYTLYLSAIQYPLGHNTTITSINTNTPTGWTTTGENGNNNTGPGDGVPNGVLAVSVGTTDVENKNFGIWEICAGSTIFGMNLNGNIQAFVDPSSSAALRVTLNPTVYAPTTVANALGYNPINGKFYYFNTGGTNFLSKVFVSYDPTTRTYETLNSTGFTIGIGVYRGAVNNTGTGYYTLEENARLRYYSIATDTWTTITSNFTDQYGANISTLLRATGGGDLAIDGSGALWILAGTVNNSPSYLYKVSSAPTTSQSSLLVTLVWTGLVGQTNGIAFSASGELYIGATNPSGLYRLNSDYTVTYMGNYSNGFSSDLAGCGYPVNPFPHMDFGDAPDSYGTTMASNGPRHEPSYYNENTDTARLMLGAKIDIELDANFNATATGDDITGMDDEDGISIFPLIPVSATSYSVTVNVHNTTDQTATLSGWIDFNRNGVFDPSEKSTVIVPANATTAVLNWTGLSGLTVGNMYSRFRIATSASEVNLPTGSASDGEVEDYYAPIVGVSVTGTVFGDANGNTVIDGGENGTNAGVNLYVYMVNSDGVVIDSAKIGTNGTYTLFANPNQLYTIELSTIQYPLGHNTNATPINTDPPTGWVRTGENGTNNSGPGDSYPDGKLSVQVGTSNVNNQNFGIQQPPVADDKIYHVPNLAFSETPPFGYPDISSSGSRYFMIATDNSMLTGYTHNGSLTGKDEEDCRDNESCNTGSTFVLDSLYDGTLLFYNFGGEVGVRQLVVGDTIKNYDPSKLVIYAHEGLGMGSTPVGFTYSIIDNAGFSSPPSNYTILTESALPVELLYFTAKVNSCEVILDWSTASELNNDFFILYSSRDFVSWRELTRVQGQGTVNYRTDYSYTDQVNRDGTVYYRLVQTDYDGMVDQLPVVAADVTACTDKVLAKVYPNPAREHIQVEISGNTNNGLYHYVLTDALGRVIREVRNKVAQTQIEVSDLPAGNYYLRISAGDEILKTEKIVIIR